MKIAVVILVFSSLVSMGTWAVAQGNSSYHERTVFYTTVINGKDNPEGIPYATKWNLLLRSYNNIQDELEVILSTSDGMKLAAFVQADANHRAVTEATIARKHEQLCSKVDVYSADEILVELSRLETQDNQNTEARFSALEKSLSSDGRAAINTYIDTEILPNASVAIIDTIAADREFPEQFINRYKANCTVDRAELKRQFDKFIATQTGTGSESSESKTMGSITEK